MQVTVGTAWAPFSYQRAFHNSRARFRLAAMGTRAGKTHTAVNEAIRLATDPKYAARFGLPCPNMGFIVGRQYKQVGIVRDIFFNPSYLPEEFNPPGSFRKDELLLEMPNGSRIWFRSADDPDSLRGQKLHWFIMDEAAFMSEMAWHILRERIADSRGIGMFTTTPRGRNWLFRNVAEKALKGHKDYSIVQASFFDNPMISADERASIQESGMSAALMRQEYGGEFVSLEGLVYPEFEYKKHVVQTIPWADIHYWYLGVDWGFTTPAVVLIIGRTDEDKLYVVREIYESKLVINQLIEKTRAVWEQVKLESGARVKSLPLSVCDPSEPAYIQDFKLAGFHAVEGENDIIPGVTAVLTRLLGETIKNERGEPICDPYSGEPLTVPKLYIHERCKMTIAEFGLYAWPEYDEGSGDEPPQKPVDRDDHAMDALRYVIFCLRLTRVSKRAEQVKKAETIIERHLKQMVRQRAWTERLGVQSIEEVAGLTRPTDSY